MSGEAERPRFDPRHDAIYQRGYQPDDEPRADAAASVGQAPAAPAAGTHTAADQAEDVDLLAEAPRANPFIRALWIVGIAMVVLGLLLQWQANASDGFASWNGMGDKPLELMVLQMIFYIASPMFQVGSLTIVGLLFWHAIQWRTAHSRN